MPNRIPTPTLGTIPVRKSTTAQNAAIYQKQVSPAGVAKAAANNRGAMAKMYPSAYPTVKSSPSLPAAPAVKKK